MLEPEKYDRLFSAVQDFMNKLYDFYYACTQTNSPITSQIQPVKLYNVLNLIPQVIPRMYFLTIIGKIVLQKINAQLIDFGDKSKVAELKA